MRSEHADRERSALRAERTGSPGYTAGQSEYSGIREPEKQQLGNRQKRQVSRPSEGEARAQRGERRKAAVSAEKKGNDPDAASAVPVWQQRLQERRRRRVRRALTVFGGLLGIAYIAVAVYFGFHFYEGVEIYGIDCSQKTVDLVKAEVADRLDDYQLAVEARGGQTEYLTAAEIGLEFVDNSSIDRMLKAQKSYVWPVMLFLKREATASVAFSYDTKAAASAFEELGCMNRLAMEAPQDAYVRTTDTGFVVEPEVLGTTLDPEKSKQALYAALDAGRSTLSLEEQDCYVKPQVYQDDKELHRVAEGKSALAKAYITYDFGDRQEIVNAPVIDGWITTRSDGSFVIDDMLVSAYVEELAAKYDTFGLTREFVTSSGTTVSLSGGDYGWCMDQDATVVALLNALADGYQGTMEPEYVFTGMSRNTNDIGDTYVEVCLSQQRMWCYENGVCIVDTPVVTGNPNKGNATPSGGVWAIDAKMREYVLKGEGYQAPVDYWMPFNGDVGIHDMQQRAYFGGTIYLSNGSHGCVNTPYEQAQMIYNAVSIGTPVIVYE